MCKEHAHAQYVINFCNGNGSVHCMMAEEAIEWMEE